MNIIQATDTPESYETVVRFRRNAQVWLDAQGQDQWQNDWPDSPTMLDGFAQAIVRGETWFAVDDDQVLAIITINQRTADGLWTPAEVDGALFVHRLTVDRATSGRGVGARLLDFAGEQAEAAGKGWVRLDAWTNNQELHRYYLSQGFRHVRTVEGHFSPSAACFERPASYRRETIVAGSDDKLGLQANDQGQAWRTDR